MWSFLHGWRRRVAVVTLVMALGMMGLWMRSYFVADQVTIHPHLLYSEEGRLLWGTSEQWSIERLGWESFTGREGPLWLSVDSESKEILAELASESIETFWWLRSAVLSLGHLNLKQQGYTVRILIIPYWSLVLPLTLLSAYLILWKPRKSSDLPTISNLISN